MFKNLQVDLISPLHFFIVLWRVALSWRAAFFWIVMSQFFRAALMSRTIYPSVEAKCILRASKWDPDTKNSPPLDSGSETCPLRPSFADCKISGVVLISAFKRRFGGGLCFVHYWINFAHGQTHNKNISSIHTSLDRQASRTRDKSRVHIKFTFW